MKPPPTLTPLVDGRRVILVVGCGGVGKTTVTAALGLAAAQRGRRVLCLTIDPARRLANSLGLSRMTSEAQEVAPALFEAAGLRVQGSLTVMMLDTKRTFDDLVSRHASSPEARDRILHNRLYRYVSTSLAGTQEYMAMEKLLSVRDDPRFDLVVLDTPPTSNALDFLDAPERLVQALDSAAMRWFIQAFDASRKFSLNLLARSAALILKAIGRLTGGGFLEQVAEFVTDLNDLFGGLKQRAALVAKAFRGPEFAYVLVTSPEPVAVREVLFFAERLKELGMRRDGFVVNRVHKPPRSLATPAEIGAALGAHRLTLGDRGSERIERAIADEQKQAELDVGHLDALGRALVGGASEPATVRVDVPALPSDVHDLGTLAGIASLLCPA